MNTAAAPSRPPPERVPPPPRPAGRPRLLGWWLVVLVGALAVLMRADLAHVRWADRLSREGSPPPALQADSPTGYAGGQRHYLGTHQRGETYRWIAATQAALQDGFAASPHYTGDTLPTGRPQLLPRLHLAWLGTLSWVLHASTGTALPQAAEQAAQWEPLLTHLLAFLGITALVFRRFGAASAAGVGLFFALYPPLFSQFVPGALTAETWALLLATYVMAAPIRRFGDTTARSAFGPGSAVAAAGALWLNPAFGVAAILTAAAVGFIAPPPAKLRAALRWSILGAVLVTAAWWLNRAPWDVTAGELRSVHPWYAVAWLGLGLGLHGWHNRQQSDQRRRHARFAVIGALALLLPLVYAQVQHGLAGWWHPTPMLRRFASLDSAPIYSHLFHWLRTAPWAEVMLLLAPLLVALGFLLATLRRSRADATLRRWLAVSAIPFGAVMLLTLVHVRWLAPAALLSALVVTQLAGAGAARHRWVASGGAALYLFVLMAWGQALPASFRPSAPPANASAADLESLVYRHFSHWLAQQSAGAELRVLAPPALSDSLVYHGGARALLSSAWESHPGHVAAARVLSAPEATEAEAVIERLGLTHLVITSWDEVFPLLVKQPLEAERDTLYDRLQRWVLPPYLRPLPYRLPPTPGFAAAKLAVFEIVPPQDEALALSRLAEYFVEVDRPDPARRVAEALHGAHLADPNAAMARALVAEASGDRASFERELGRVVAHVQAGLVPMDPDRRVIRAIVLALGRRHDLARPEVEAVNANMSAETLRLLTPRQVFQLRRLLERYQLDFASDELSGLARTRSAGYQL